jgi:hypothetical protein
VRVHLGNANLMCGARRVAAPAADCFVDKPALGGDMSVKMMRPSLTEQPDGEKLATDTHSHEVRRD